MLKGFLKAESFMKGRNAAKVFLVGQNEANFLNLYEVYTDEKMEHDSLPLSRCYTWFFCM